MSTLAIIVGACLVWVALGVIVVKTIAFATRRD